MRRITLLVLSTVLVIVGMTPASAANFTLTQTIVGQGTVTSDDTFINCPGTCTHSYSNIPAPVVVTLTESPAPGWHFDHWNGSVCEGDVTVTCQITMSNTRAITATFVQDGGGGGVHFIGAGDISTGGNGDTQTSNRVLALLGAGDFAWTAGDNVYPQGSLNGFNTLYDPTWGRFANQTYPTPGNHDYMTSGASGYFTYFQNNWGGSGNVPTYYRAQVGAWDVYGLNSEIAHTSGSTQVNWLVSELAAHPTACIAAIWHQPRWSSGNGHGNNTSMQPFWDALAAANADLILNGHDHDYERFAEKQGIREFVVGTGGTGLRGFNAPQPGSEKRILSLGVLDLTLTATGYDFDFFNPGGTSLDSGSGSC